MVADVDKPKLVFGFMRPIYNALEPISYLILRVALAAAIIPHGYEKIFLGAAQNATRNKIFALFGDPLVGVYFIAGLEFFGGIMLLFGLLTRIVAAAFAIEMAVIAFAVLFPSWWWTQRGMEYVLLMGMVALVLWMRGGGRFSLDRLIGREF